MITKGQRLQYEEPCQFSWGVGTEDLWGDVGIYVSLVLSPFRVKTFLGKDVQVYLYKSTETRFTNKVNFFFSF